MKRLAGLWIVFAIASFAVIASSADQSVMAQDGQEATIAALQTEVAGLQTMVALQTEVAGLKTQIAGGHEAATASTTPSPSSNPEPGTVLYEADASGGFDTWTIEQGWEIFDGMLSFGGERNRPSLRAYPPYSPGAVSDYAVEVELELLDGFGDCNNIPDFGVLVRHTDEGYYANQIVFGCGPSVNRAEIYASGESSGQIAEERFVPDIGRHTLRVEVQGRAISFFFDGALLAQARDNRHSAGGGVALSADGVLLDVLSFRVIAL